MVEKYYELGGRLYEVVTACALDDLNIEYMWNPPLLLMYVVPDFVIPTQDNPRAIILVTHSTSSRGTTMKFWRNIHELFEIKTHISPRCLAINLVYCCNRGWKKQLLHILRSVFDNDLIVFRKPYGQEFLDRLHRIVLKEVREVSFNDAKQIFKKILIDDAQLGKIYRNHFLPDLKHLLDSSPKADLLDLWEKEYNRLQSEVKEGKPWKVQNTYFKRGLIKASFLSEKELIHLKKLIGRGSKIHLRDIVNMKKHLKDLDLIEIDNLLFGQQVTLDEELKFVLEVMRLDDIRSLIRCASQTYPRLERYLFKMKQTDNVRKMIKLICERLRNTTNPSISLRKMLKGCYEGENYLGIPSKRNWVFETCIDIIRYFKPELRYSYDVLSHEVGIPMTGAPSAKLSPIPMFVTGRNLLPRDVLRNVSSVLTEHILSIGLEKIEANIDKMVRESCRHTFITLAKHRIINLLKMLIIRAVESCGWKVVDERVRIRSCLAEYAGTKAGIGDSFYTLKVQKGNITAIVDVIAAYTSTHKHKELSGRVMTSRYIWNETIQKFQKEKKINKWILVLDGPWKKLFGGSTKFLEMFYEGGWDFVTYPDGLSGVLKSLE